MGLPAAAGVYVVSKVLKKQVDRLSSAVYTVKGSWDQPDVKFSKLFSNDPKVIKGGGAVVVEERPSSGNE